MRKLLAVFVGVVVCAGSHGQSRAALEGDHNLQDRYQLMKEKAETFNDYKVIKNTILDGVWKITMDSLKKEKDALRKANATISQLNAEVAKADGKVKQADASILESNYERSHLYFIGIPMAKSFFVTMMCIIVAVLLGAFLTAVASAKVLRRSNKEKELAIFGITTEFDEFRKKALQKEVKISRELQDERNKLAAISKG